jgi:cephalosporin hydroxylase
MAERPNAKMAVASPGSKARAEIVGGLRAHEPLIFEFAKAWYNSPYTFRQTRVLGWPACKIPLDLWIYMDLFTQYRFTTVVECGTAGGGTTLWYAILMDLLGIPGHVWSIDIELPGPGEARPEHPRITYIHGSSTDPEVADRIMAETGRGTYGPGLRPDILVNLDSNHHAPHVLEELRLWAPLVPVGGWLVVEDTNGAPVMEDAAGHPLEVEGPLAAVLEYLAGHPGEWFRDVLQERYWLTMNPHGWLQRERAWNGRR